MKRIDTTQETSTSWSPYKVESKAFMQDANKEMIAAICYNIISNHGLTYSETTPYLITVQNAITQSGIYTLLSDGAVFYGGELYLMLENTGLTYAVIDNSINTAADPTIFSDGTSHNIHKNRYLNFTNTSAGSLFAVADIVDVTARLSQSFTNVTPSSDWTVPTTYGGYANSFQMRKNINNEIEFKGGILAAVTNSTSTVYTLPTGQRPTTQRSFVIFSSDSNKTVIVIYPDGIVRLTSSPSNFTSGSSYMAFDTIRFSLD